MFLAALIGGALLAAIRGELLARQLQPADTSVITDENAAGPEPAPISFYQSTGSSLRMLMVFLALAIDLGAGVAVHRALAAGEASGDDYESLFRQSAAGRKVLMIFSDMRHVTRGLDLESPGSTRTEATLKMIERQRLFADLTGVSVQVFAANAAGRDVTNWDSLKMFWIAYFRAAGATLKEYSTLPNSSSILHWAPVSRSP